MLRCYALSVCLPLRILIFRAVPYEVQTYRGPDLSSLVHSIQRTSVYIRRTLQYSRNLVEIMLLFSILTAYSYYPFPRREIRTVLDLFYWGNVCNNYILACKCIRFLHSQLVIKSEKSYLSILVRPIGRCHWSIFGSWDSELWAYDQLCDRVQHHDCQR
jgi:hypothetical protein